MSTQPTLTDEQRRAHFSELGQRAVESRRATKAAVRRIVETTRAAQGLPPTVTDLEVLERVAALIDANDRGAV
jgi:hypothetical protein